MTFRMKQFPILDKNFEEVFGREMRSYLVKSEADF